MQPSNLSALNRIALWFAPYVCLPLFLMHPAKAGPTPQTAAAASVVVVMPLAAPEAPAPAAAPAVETVHVVLTRGPMRLELDLPVDGKVAPATADDIARMMRDPASGRMRRIASGTLALLADVALRYPGHEIEVVSAVRAEPDRTRDGIKHSKHWDGHAIDLIVRDAKLAEVRDEMWKNHHDIGVGWYPEGGFIHIDYRPDVHDMAWTQPRKNADNIYHPRWSLLARDPDIQLAASRAAMRHLLVKIATALGYTDAGAHHDA
jgi:uncharacterized protein YcbK (DUF882 family)